MDSVSNSNVERYGKSLDQDFFKQCFSMCSTLIIMNKYDLIKEKKFSKEFDLFVPLWNCRSSM